MGWQGVSVPEGTPGVGCLGVCGTNSQPEDQIWLHMHFDLQVPGVNRMRMSQGVGSSPGPLTASHTWVT